MLDSRRDCRYRGGAHRNIGVGLGKVTFHNMLGTPEEVPGIPLTLIHPRAWKVNTRKFILPEGEGESQGPEPMPPLYSSYHGLGCKKHARYVSHRVEGLGSLPAFPLDLG